MKISIKIANYGLPFSKITVLALSKLTSIFNKRQIKISARLVKINTYTKLLAKLDVYTRIRFQLLKCVIYFIYSLDN